MAVPALYRQSRNFIARAHAYISEYAVAAATRFGVSTVILLYSGIFAFAKPALAAETTFEQIVQSLKSSDLKTKYAALQSLQTYHMPESADVLAGMALREKDANFRLAVLDQLAVLGYDRVIPTITPLLKDKTVPVRQRTARVIGMLGGPTAEKPLMQALATETHPDVKAALLQGLSLCGSEQSVQTIQSALSDARPEVRANAVGALRRIPGERSNMALEKARGDTDKNVRKLAEESLKKRPETK